MQLIAIEGHESQRRKLEELLAELARSGLVLRARMSERLPSGWPEALALAKGRGLFDAKSVTVIEGAEQLGPFPPALIGLLDQKGDSNVLVTVFTGDAKKTFPKELDKAVTFIRADQSVPPWKRKDWIIGLARERGASIEPAAAALLAETIESQEELRSEIDKLIACSDDKAITAALVRALSFDEGGGVMLRFLDGVCMARGADVVSAMRRLSSDPSPLLALTSLYNRLRPALYASAFKDQASEQLPRAGAYAERMAKSALANYGAEHVKEFMLRLIGLSYTEKTSASGGWPAFEAAVWKLMS
ncbi:MAG: hypothetical protein LBR38_06910 [Synergistaceae bacterium]|jgi:DNA polymerase-3 subunit delta|nr:hypothetical protein [Synergistaceae bacterium]